MELQDKIILIVGGANGIGKAAAELCAARGAQVVVADINEDISKKRSEVAPLKRFDVITHVDEYAVSSPEKFVEAINAVKKGESFSYRLLRKGITKILRAQKAP